MTSKTSRGGVMTKIIIIIIVVVGGLFLLLNGYFGFMTTYGWETYKDDTIGMSVKYPKDGFEVQRSDAYKTPTILLTSKNQDQQNTDVSPVTPAFTTINHSVIKISKASSYDDNAMRSYIDDGYLRRNERINGNAYTWLEKSDDNNGKTQRSILVFDTMGNIAIEASDDYENDKKHLMTTTETIIKSIELK